MMFKNIIIAFCLLAVSCEQKENRTPHTTDSVISVEINAANVFQTIDNFGASDAWACQFAGNWPDAKRNAMADLLFSMDTLSDGSPKGIGLSAWRFNFGGGSTQQGDASGIKDEWRRAESFLDADNRYNWNRQKGQTWFLQAAHQRGVRNFIGFYNSPPVQFTRNGKAYASNSVCNIDSRQYTPFADYVAETIKGVKQHTGVDINYLSPINEPQWDWSDGGQEGSPYYNSDISGLIKAIDQTFQQKQIATKIILPEAAEYYYLYEDRDKKGKGSQINAFFNETSTDYVGNLPSIANIVAAHSYFTSSPFEKAVTTRKQVAAAIAGYKGLRFWQSEYCVLGDNDGEIKGEGKDLSITPALYVAKLIYNDLVNAQATAWQWWLAVSPYDYKDGLVYIDMDKADGKYYSSKLMWALGNYSRFVRPGMQRVAITLSEAGVLASAYLNKDAKQVVVVAINESAVDKTISCGLTNQTLGSADVYTTSANHDLTKTTAVANKIVIPAKGISTIVLSY